MAVALPYIYYAAIVASTYVAVTASQSAAKSASALGDLQAQLNQKQAATAVQQADASATDTRSRNDRIRAQQKVSFLQSGLTISGSANDVIYDSSLEGELNALNEEYKGKVASNYYQSEGAISLVEGQSRATAARMQGYGSVLSGVGAAAGGPSFGAAAKK